MNVRRQQESLTGTPSCPAAALSHGGVICHGVGVRAAVAKRHNQAPDRMSVYRSNLLAKGVWLCHPGALVEHRRHGLALPSMCNTVMETPRAILSIGRGTAERRSMMQACGAYGPDRMAGYRSNLLTECLKPGGGRDG